MRATFRIFYDEFNVAVFVRKRHNHALSVIYWTQTLVPMAAVIGTLCAAFMWASTLRPQPGSIIRGCGSCCRPAAPPSR